MAIGGIKDMVGNQRGSTRCDYLGIAPAAKTQAIPIAAEIAIPIDRPLDTAFCIHQNSYSPDRRLGSNRHSITPSAISAKAWQQFVLLFFGFW